MTKIKGTFVVLNNEPINNFDIKDLKKPSTIYAVFKTDIDNKDVLLRAFYVESDADSFIKDRRVVDVFCKYYVQPVKIY